MKMIPMMMTIWAICIKKEEYNLSPEIDRKGLTNYILNHILWISNYLLVKLFEMRKEIRIMLEKMKEIIAEQLSVEAETITETTSFKEDLGADSLDLFELVMSLEEEYNVEIPSEDLENLTTVGEVMDYLKKKGGEE